MTLYNWESILSKVPFFMVIAALLLSGCASTSRHIIPKAGGQYEVIANGKHRSDAMEEALQGAEDICEERKMHHVVSEHSVKYDGILSEAAGKTAEKVADVIGTISGSYLPTLGSKDDYEVKLSFTCEK